MTKMAPRYLPWTKMRLIGAIAAAVTSLIASMVMAAPTARAEVPTPAAQYTVGAMPKRIAVNSAGTIAVVANNSDNTASVINLVTSSVATVPVGTSPYGVAIDGTGTFAYVTNSGSATVTRIRLDDNSTTTINVGANPLDIEIDPAGAYAYIAVGANADRIDLTNNVVSSGYLVGITGPLVFTSDGAKIYSCQSTLKEFNPVTGGVAVQSISTGIGSCTGAVLNADNTLLFGVNDSGWVRRVDLTTQVTTVWASGAGYNAVALERAGDFAYSIGQNDHTVYKVSLVTSNSVTVLASQLLNYPYAAAIPADGSFILVPVQTTGVVDRFSLLSAPDAPPAPSVIAGDARVTVTAAAAGSGSAATSLLVTSSPGSLTCSITGSSGSCDVAGLTNGQTYTFTAVAVGAGGSSAASTPSAAVTPEGVTSSSADTTTFTLTLDDLDGQCTGSRAINAGSGSWVSLPSAGDCIWDGHQLVGWAVGAPNSRLTLRPGGHAHVTGDNRLIAVWESIPVTSVLQVAPTSPSVAAQAKIRCQSKKSGSVKSFKASKCPKGWNRLR